MIPGSNPDFAKLYSLFKFNQIEIKMWRKRQSHGFEPHHRQTDKLYVGKSSLCLCATRTYLSISKSNVKVVFGFLKTFTELM